MRYRKPSRRSSMFDDAAVLAALVKVKLSAAAELTTDEELILEALRRSNGSLVEADTAEIHDYLGRLAPEQIAGVVNNVKGIFHEVAFVEAENADGDPVTAALFPDTNHEGYDVLMSDSATGESWEIQLKATADASDVQDWLDTHPGGEILITSELAKRMGLGDSGFDNETLTVQVEQFVDYLQDLEDEDSIWDHLPVLTLATTAIIVWELWQRQARGDITPAEFRRQAAWAAGCKAAKMVGLACLLSVPVLGTVTGTVLVARFILSVDRAVRRGRGTE